MKEACGVFGVYAPGKAVAQLTFDGMFALVKAIICDKKTRSVRQFVAQRQSDACVCAGHFPKVMRIKNRTINRGRRMDRSKYDDHIYDRTLGRQGENRFRRDGAAADPSRMRYDCAEPRGRAWLTSAAHHGGSRGIEKLGHRLSARRGVGGVKHPGNRGMSN